MGTRPFSRVYDDLRFPQHIMKHMGSRIHVAALAAVTMAAVARPAFAGTLNGSHASMQHQHAVAVKLDYSFVRTPGQVRALVADSALERVVPNADVELSNVSFPFARPAVREFIERLAQEYHAATGAPLVVTSLTRPTSLQPRNASPLSVHPAGMAVDLRIPAAASALDWLEHKLLALEQAGVIDVTREHHPPHLHVAVFPEQYAAYAAQHPVAPTVLATRDTAIQVTAPGPSRAVISGGESRSMAAIATGSASALLLGTLLLAIVFRAGTRRAR